MRAKQCFTHNALRHSWSVLDVIGFIDGPEVLGDPVALSEELGDMKSWVTRLEAGSREPSNAWHTTECTVHCPDAAFMECTGL